MKSNKKILPRYLLCLFSMMILCSTMCLYSNDRLMITVKENTAVKLHPINESLTLKILLLGTELVAEEKIGDWLKVRLPPNQGDEFIIGYVYHSDIKETGKGLEVLIYLKDGRLLRARILAVDERQLCVKKNNEKFVFEKMDVARMEPILEEIITKEERPAAIRPVPKQKQKTQETATYRAKLPRWTIAFGLGGSLLNLDASSSYSDNWSYGLLDSVVEKDNIKVSSENTLSALGSITYFAGRNIGFQLRSGYFKSQVPNRTEFNFNWTWYDGSSYFENSEWTGTGELRIIPISLNLISRFGTGRLTLYLAGGYSLFSNRLSASSFIGLGATYEDVYYQYVDAIKIPAAINGSWISNGVDIGGGLNIKMGQNIGVFLEGFYYYSGSKEFAWKLQAGEYTGIYYGDFYVVLSDYYAELYEKDVSKLRVNPSFFQISLGIDFFF